MTGTNNDRQPDLLDDFWNALQAEATTQPPAALNARSADLVRELERELRPPDPRDAFVAQLRARLQPARSASRATNAAPQIPPGLTAVKHAAPDAGPGPTLGATQRRGIGWEALKLAAAIVSIAVVGTMLVLLFRDSDPAGSPDDRSIQPAGEPATETSQPVVAPPSEPIHQVAFAAYGDDGVSKQLILANADSSRNVPLTSAVDAIYVGMPTWSPDGRYLAYIGGSEEAGIVVLDVLSGETRSLEGTSGAYWPRWSPDGTMILYARLMARGPADLFVVNPDGGEPQNLTNNDVHEFSPTWSPDGSMIAFASDETGNSEIYVMDRDGGNRRNISNQQGDDFVPSWSPDGNRIAFNSHPSGNADIYVADLMTGEVTNITNTPEDEIYAVWSPAGDTIAYTHSAADDEVGRTHLWLMDVDGTNRRPLISDDAYAAIHAAWSPDGTQIAVMMQMFGSQDSVYWNLIVTDLDGREMRFLSDRAAETDFPAWRTGTNANVMPAIVEPGSTPTITPSNAPTPPSEPVNAPSGELLISIRVDSSDQRLFVIAADGLRMGQLIPDDALDGDQWDGVWSPDGSQVAFSVQQDGASDLYVVNADGSNLRQLVPAPPQTSNPNRVLSQGSPSWSPDGTKIAFASSRAWDRGGLDIYVVNADGSDLQRLTDSDLAEFSPVWSPDGAMIAYEVNGGSADHYGNIYVMNSDGSDQRRLVEATSAGDPNWSPDGEWIAYSDGRFCCAVHIVRVDGTDRRDLSGTGFSARWPRWSPDGSMLAWSAHSDGGSFDGVLVLDLATDEVRHISSLAGRLEWSPDGRWIVVARHAFDLSGRQIGEAGLYMMRPDGSDERLLLDIPVDEYDTHIDWRPATDD